MKSLFVLVLTIFTVLSFSLSSNVLAACTTSSSSSSFAMSGAEELGNNCNGANIVGKNSLATKIVNLVTDVVGVIVILIIIYAGFKYITSGGDANKIKSAKDTLTNAIIGLVIVIFARVLIDFVINLATKK